MTDQPITFETEALAKKKGFGHKPTDYNVSKHYTQSALQKWLRDKHKIFLWIEPQYDMAEEEFDLLWWEYWIVKSPSSPPIIKMCGNIEETLEAGLQEALKLIKDELTIDTHQR